MNDHYPFSISNHFQCRLVQIHDNMFMSEFIGYGHAIWLNYIYNNNKKQLFLLPTTNYAACRLLR